jgi:tRNA threonylcarbamoyladenosine biosynthesis protein TsaB
MLLLITDTSGKNGSVALARVHEGAAFPEVIESVPLAGGTFSAQLVPQIAELLRRNGYGKHDIGAFIVVAGPGSFTGLRVGLAAIKALAEILGKPIIPVSLLEIIAVISGAQGAVLAALDAGRGDVYAGEYEFRDGNAQLVREQLLTKNEFASVKEGLAIATSEETLAEALRSAGNPARKVNVTAASISRVGWQKFRAGQTASPEQLDANYIRRSDAEIFARPVSSS